MITEELKRAMPKSIISHSQAFQIPRSYQTELFEMAKESNVIAVLDTGSGKTLIALLLMQHMALLSQQKLERQVSVFLVPTVPIVSQQSEYLATNSKLNVGQIHGAQNSGSMDEESWAQSSGKFDVIVMTPAILLNGMDRGFVKMQQVSGICYTRLRFFMCLELTV
jgi:endoribonuclease Dicer